MYTKDKSILDIVMLQQWGLLDHPVIVKIAEAEKARNKKIKQLLESIEKELDDNLLVAVVVANAKEELKNENIA